MHQQLQNFTMSFESSPTFKSASLGEKNMPTMNKFSILSTPPKNATPQRNCHWIIDDFDTLPEVPMFYPIEQTSVIIKTCEPREISDRIVACLQKLSIAASFCSSNASLLAETLDHTTFYIRLYKRCDGNEATILVEMQKVDGDSVDYMKCVRAILAYAQGEELVEETPKRKRCSSLTCLPPSLVHGKRNTINSCRSEDLEAASSVQYAEELLLKDRIDAVQLGMDSLLLLTDSEKSHASQSAAEAVLQGDSSGHSTIKNFIQDLVQVCPSIDSQPRDEKNSDFASRQEHIMHNMALAVLGNSLQTAFDADSSSLKSIVMSDEWMGDSGIVNALISELSHANNRSHDAYHAARCLNILLETSPDMKKELSERGLQFHMRASQSVGRSRHSLLARECDAALASLEKSQH